MNARPTSVTTRLIGLAGLVTLTLAMVVTLARAQVTPTNEWVDFFSTNTTLLGQPVPVGAIVAAFDPQGTQCAEFTVLVDAAYGVMPCYRDDGTTPDDEGAEPEDLIFFTINGLPATPVPVSLNAVPVPPETTITWTSNGDLWEVDLQVVATSTSEATSKPRPKATRTPRPTPSPTAPSRAVGGYGEPLSALALLAPWIILATGIAMGAIGIVLLRRRVA